MSEVNAECAACCRELEDDELPQFCARCGMDGLGNCCIGDMDHECIEDDHDD